MQATFQRKGMKRGGVVPSYLCGFTDRLVPLWCLSERRQDLLRGGDDTEHALEVYGPHEVAVDHLLEAPQEVVVITIDIEYADGFGVESQLLPSEDLEQFLEGADTARESKESIGEVGDSAFASVHIGCDDELRAAFMFPSLFDHKLWDDAHDFTTMLQGSVGDSAHESGMSATIDETDVFGGEDSTKLLSSSDIRRYNEVARCSVDG